jgi:hypothetical protein
MEPEGSSPPSKQPTTCPYSEPDQSNHSSPFYCLKIYFICIFIYKVMLHHLLMAPEVTRHRSGERYKYRPALVFEIETNNERKK